MFLVCRVKALQIPIVGGLTMIGILFNVELQIKLKPILYFQDIWKTLCAKVSNSGLDLADL